MIADALYLEPPLRTFSVGGVTAAWRESGAGSSQEPLVLLHGIGSNARAWAGQFAAFSLQRRVIAWNAPGYAGSTPLQADWPTSADYAGALVKLLDYLGVTRCLLVGQSLGATMAVAFAKAWPERVSGLVLASPAAGYGIRPDATLNASIADRIADLETLGPEALAQKRYGRLLTVKATPEAHAIVRKAMSEISQPGYGQACRLLAGADLVAEVEGLHRPPAVLWGSEDVITPPEACRRVAAAAGGAAVELPGLGHAAATEDPRMFNAALDALLIEQTTARA